MWEQLSVLTGLHQYSAAQAFHFATGVFVQHPSPTYTFADVSRCSSFSRLPSSDCLLREPHTVP